MPEYTVTNSASETATADVGRDGWVTLAVGSRTISLNDDEVEKLVTALRNAARDAAERTALRPLDDEAATNLKLLCAIAADFWDKDERNAEYERGQSELIRDFVRWQGWPPETGTITEHVLALVAK